MCLFLFLFQLFWEVGLGGYFCDLCQRLFCLPKFSSNSFILSAITWRYLIRFEFIFVCVFRKYPSFIILHVVNQFSQHHLLKRLFSPLYNLYFWLCAGTILYWWLLLCSIIWSRKCWFPQFHSSSSRLLWLFMGFCVSYKLWKYLF